MNTAFFMDIFVDSLQDGLGVFPFLFLAYALLEYLEKYSSEKTIAMIARARKTGPAIGAICGLLPQCGFAAAAANLFAARVISLGTLIAVFLTTSDELLPILLSNSVPLAVVAKIIGIKFVIGLFFGYLCMFFMQKKQQKIDIESLCEKEDCHCAGGGIIRPALYHAVKITIFVWAITLVINLVLQVAGDDWQHNTFLHNRVMGVIASAAVGLLPNCSVSVALSQMWVENVISLGALIAGLSSGVGVGLLVLFRVNTNRRENIKIAAMLYIFAVVAGILVEVLQEMKLLFLASI